MTNHSRFRFSCHIISIVCRRYVIACHGPSHYTYVTIPSWPCVTAVTFLPNYQHIACHAACHGVSHQALVMHYSFLTFQSHFENRSE